MFLVVAHILALHEVGSNNPDGIEIKKVKGPDGIPLDGIAFHPYYTVKDTVGRRRVPDRCSALVVFFAPEMGGYFLEHANFEPANPLQTPEHIAPVWYFTPFYAILRAVPNKLVGVGLMVRRRAAVRVPAVARSRQGALDPLPRLAVQDVRGRCSRSASSRSATWACKPATTGLHERRAHLHGLLLRVFPAHALGTRASIARSRCRTG